MSDEQVRREFEAKFPMPANDGVKFNGTDYWLDSLHSGDQVIFETFYAKWAAYQAAHQSRQAEIDRLTAELAECKKDSERYRWLCASDWYIGPEPQGDTNVVSLYNESTDNEGLNLSKEIDAAMEATK